MRRHFDLFGFAFIALGVGALQMMLDRGAELDWFASTEVWIELGLAIIGFWVATIHIATAERPFLDPRMFADFNFVAALVMIFVIGMVLMASMALLPPMLSRIYGYPVMTTGMVMAPRGMGTMLSMVLVGQLVRFVDPRLLIAVGLALTAYSLHLMTGFSPVMGSRPFVISGVLQGIGMGLVFVPLSTTAFATMAVDLRADATALFSLVRNIGSSIGISVVGFLLTRNIQVNHTELVSGLTITSPELLRQWPVLDALPGGVPWNVLDGLVTQQALMISYLDDFVVMMWLCLAVLPLTLILRRPGVPAGPAAHHME